MSDNINYEDKKADDSKKVLEIFNQELKKEEELFKRKKDVEEKGLILKEHRITRDLNELVKNTAEIEQANTVNFGKMSQENIDKLVLDNQEYMEAARHAMVFINEEFKKTVPYFRKNLILVGGDTGDGKSTTVANIVFSTLTRKNPSTGKSCRVLVLSNEEAPEDFYNRVTSLVKGWKYANHDQFTDEQRKIFNEYIPIWAKDGRLTIIGDVYQGIPGCTTTPEGIETIFNNLIRDNEFYDVILIDYYQNVRFSKLDPKINEYECQRRLSGMLDQMKLRYPAPIIVMAQMKRLVDEEDTTPFNVRIKGSKLICDKATFICELIPERKLLLSKWKVWKSRFTESVGQCVYTGYDRGRFVPYSIAFQKNVAKLVDKNLERDKEEELGIVNNRNEDNE
jgi:replicative DNA helicase